MTDTSRYAGKTILLGITGSIAAYKAVSLVRRLRAEGATVNVVMTRTAQRFVGPMTFEVLTGRPVGTELFAPSVGMGGARVPVALQDATGDGPPSTTMEMAHLTLAESADVIVIAPASAHCLAKMAHGLADDLLSTLILAATCPVVAAPAMDGGMWDHPAVRDNVVALRRRGVTVLEPESGLLASGATGQGRLPGEDAILAAISHAFVTRKDFQGRRVLVTAGPTQEALDPVRFLSNRSSGKMGWALAEAARNRGAEVTLVAGPTALNPPPGVAFVPVITSEEMQKAIVGRFSDTDVLIMAAAVADFRAARTASGKIPKGEAKSAGGLTVVLEPTPDILMDLVARRTGQIVVGFAAETAAPVERARRKLAAKSLDLIVANDVTEPGAGFGTDTNRVTLLDRTGRCEALPLMSKYEVANLILDAILSLPPAPGSIRLTP